MTIKSDIQDSKDVGISELECSVIYYSSQKFTPCFVSWKFLNLSNPSANCKIPPLLSFGCMFVLTSY